MLKRVRQRRSRKAFLQALGLLKRQKARCSEGTHDFFLLIAVADWQGDFWGEATQKTQHVAARSSLRVTKICSKAEPVCKPIKTKQDAMEGFMSFSYRSTLSAGQAIWGKAKQKKRSMSLQNQNFEFTKRLPEGSLFAMRPKTAKD